MVCLQENLDTVETLLKKHEAFERSAATQDERFLALERLTTVCCCFSALCHFKSSSVNDIHLIF